MIRFEINNRVVLVQHPSNLDTLMRSIFPFQERSDKSETLELLDIIPNNNKTYFMKYKDIIIWENITVETLPAIILNEIENLTASNCVDTIIRSGAVKAHDKAIIILGPQGSGKSSLTTWLINHNFEYLADNFVSLATSFANIHGESSAISPLPLPIVLHAGAEALQLKHENQKVALSDGRQLLTHQAASRSEDLIEYCGLILVPHFHEGAQFEVSALSEAEVRFLLSQALHPSQRMTSFNAERASSFASKVPAISVRFGDYAQLEGQLDQFITKFISSNIGNSTLLDFCKNWRNNNTNPKSNTTTSEKIEYRSKKTMMSGRKRKLTIGMATYDDFDGAYFTLQSLRMHHPETADDVEYIVVDNNPDGPCAEPLAYLEKKIPNYRYIPVSERSGTAVRDYVMEEASCDYVLNLDCHVLLVPGAVSKLINYFEENPHTSDLLQGPIVWDELNLVSTHMAPHWDKGFFGKWALDERGVDPEASPFEIPMHGLGLYACRQAAWPYYNEKFSGFGGEEGYIHEKFRQSGGKTLCLPFLRWLHRFARPFGVPYKINWHDRIRNYLLGMDELNLPAKPVEEHFISFLGKDAERIISNINADIASTKSKAK